MRRRKAPPPGAGDPATRRRNIADQLEPTQLDRIGALPDELLGEIVLLLPMKDTARTQALASRWHRIWRSVPVNLDCCEFVSVKSTCNVSLELVSRVLAAHPGPVRRLCLKTHRPAGTMDDILLRSVALDNLEELEFLGPVQNPPESVFRFSATLRVASFAVCHLSDGVLQGVHFPRLKHLGLQHVRVSECSLHGLIAGCPALEFLLVYRGSGFRSLRINSLTLQSISVCINEPYQSTETQFRELVIEKAPSLESLIHMYAQWGTSISVISAPKVETLGFLADWNNICRRLVCTSVRGLCVGNPTTAVHTVQSIALDMTILSLDSIVDLMRLFPCLEKLHVKSKVSEDTNCWRRKHRSFIKYHDIRLKTLVLEPYLGTSRHVKFAAFFVLNAKVLELMKFQISANVYNDEFLAEQHSKLQLENKASTRARFHFTTDSCQYSDWSTNHLSDFDLKDPFLGGC